VIASDAFTTAVSFSGIFTAILIFGVLFGNLEKRIREKHEQAWLRTAADVAFWGSLVAFLLVPINAGVKACHALSHGECIGFSVMCACCLTLSLVFLIVWFRQKPMLDDAERDAEDKRYRSRLERRLRGLLDTAISQDVDAKIQEAHASNPDWQLPPEVHLSGLSAH